MAKLIFLAILALSTIGQGFYIPPRISDPCIYLNKCDEAVKYIQNEERNHVLPAKAAIRQQILQELSKLVNLEDTSIKVMKKAKRPQLFGDDNSAFEEIYMTRMG